MGFKAYHARQSDPQHWTLTQGTPVRLSGPTGLVALWVRSHQIEINVPWRVEPTDWIPAVLPPVEADEEHWIVFEQTTDTGEASYARLIGITGVAERKVELMLTFAPLLIKKPGPQLQVEIESIGRQWTEELALDGGPLSSHCTWKLTKPHLSLGAAVLRPVSTPVTS